MLFLFMLLDMFIVSIICCFCCGGVMVLFSCCGCVSVMYSVYYFS